MSEFVFWNGQLHAPGCPALEGVDARPATPADHEHADSCPRCRHGTTTYDSSERGDLQNNEHLMTDGGVELRDGEAPDQTSHGARAVAQAKVRIKATEHADLPDREAILLVALADRGGHALASEVSAEWMTETGLARGTASETANTLDDKNLLEIAPLPTDPRRNTWALTDVGEAWVRDYGGDQR